MAELKSSLLVNRQVPEFVRDEHPKFVLFLEAYYEFLDKNGYGKSRQLKNVSDVDESLQDFEQQFYNTFLPFLPRDSAVSKEVLIKNILPLYLSKGSEKSYRFLFRLLFDEEISLETPGKQILRASDGKWSQQNVLRVETEVFSEYVYGEDMTYYLPYIMENADFRVLVNGEDFVDYEFRRESKKIILSYELNEGDIVRLEYYNFRIGVLNNTRVIGLTSGASSIIENASKTNVGGLSFYQLFFDKKNFFDNFVRSETLKCEFVDNGTTIPIFLKSYSSLLRIDVVDGGSSYNIGDVAIVRGPSEQPAIAVVDDVISGTIDGLNVVRGGAGFQLGNEIFIQSVDPSFFTAEVLTLDSTGITTPNTLTFNSDVIGDFANTPINSSDYGFENSGVEDIDTVISDALSYQTITDLGSITSTVITSSGVSSTVQPNFITLAPILIGDLRISDLGCIAKVDIIDGGQDYEVGEELVFTNVGSFSGQGARAIISSVSDSGAITGIQIVDPGLSYQLDYLPSVSVDTVNGSGSVLVVSEIMGVGATYSTVVEEGLPGQIKSIRVVSQGSGYEITPGIDLSFVGDGTAKANAILSESSILLPGKWKSSAGLLSDDEIKLQGRDYYIPYSYVITSKVEFGKYKDLLKNLLHPSGLINYSKYIIRNDVGVNLNNEVYSSVIKTVSGTVDVIEGTDYVTGTNTKFTITEDSGVLTQGMTIVVNDETRVVSSIDDDETLTVESEFAQSSTNKTIKILS
jgi:hypothetical protein